MKKEKRRGGGKKLLGKRKKIEMKRLWRRPEKRANFCLIAEGRNMLKGRTGNDE